MGFFGGLQADKYDRQYSDTYLLKRIVDYLKEFKTQVFFIVIGFTFVAITAALRPIILASAVDVLAQENNMLSILARSLNLRQQIDFNVLAAGNVVAVIVGALFIAAVTEYLANWLRRRLLTRMLGHIVAKMRKQAFDSAVNRDLAFYDVHKTGKLVSRITGDTQEFGDVLLFTSDVIAQLISVFFLLVVLLQRSVLLTLVLILTLPMFMGAAVLFRNLARKATRQGSRVMAVVNDNIQESVTGISVAKNFRREAMIYDEFVAVNTQSYQVNLRRGVVLALVFPVMNLLIGIAIGLILYVGATLVVAGTITAGAWYLFIQGSERFMFPIINLASFWSQLQQGLSAAERVFALIDAENTVVQVDNKPVSDLKGYIVFEDVLFEYKEGQPVLHDFDLEIQPGESVAFVGHTGAGKSTIAKLIARFYEFQGGKICIDGKDIRTFDLQSYRSHLGIVPQQPFLFSGTIMDNIRYARPEATDDEICEIAQSIGNGEWLETLPEGLNSDVGERGARLSMGQRQLVSLLRVLVQKPAIFVLDEATASIDPFTEMQIQEALDMILARSTSILIAHRLSTVRSADRIIVLREGEIIEVGSHESLMEQGGHYAELYNTYFRHQSLSYVESSKERFSAPAAD